MRASTFAVWAFVALLVTFTTLALCAIAEDRRALPTTERP